MSKIIRFLLVGGLYLWPLLLLGLPIPDTAAAVGDIYVVDSRRDEPDANPGDGQCKTSSNRCTFRAAIDEANAQIGPNEIHFNIRNNNGSCPSSAITIEGESQYFTDLSDDKRGSYVITDDKLTIDGYTQCQAKANTEQVAGNAVIRIQITPEGSNGYGLVLNANRNLIRGLSIYGWTRSVEFRDASHNTFSGNFVGMKANGDDGNGSTGIRINFGSAYNTIGGPTPAERNILSGNGFEALDIQGAGVEQNHIINNYIGVKQNGTTELSNNGDAIDIAEEASSNWIGGILLDAFNRPILDGNGRYMADPNKRNIISGNAQDGIEISHNLATQYNQIVGNWIGVDVEGNELRNNENGVTFEDQVNNNYVYQNVIAGNGINGVRFYTVYDNYVYDNWIGVLPNGTARPNGLNGTIKGQSGVFLMGGSTGNQILRNTIAYNLEYGIYINTEAGYLSEPDNGGYGNCDSWYNTFSQNSLYNNVQQGIRLKSGDCTYPDGSPIDDYTHYPNKGINKPTITAATTAQVSGSSACANCTVEIFLVAETDTNDFDHGEGKTYIGNGQTNTAGDFTAAVSNAAANDYVTATITDSDGNTSEFSQNHIVIQATTPPPPPPPTPTPPPVPTPPPPKTAVSYIYLPFISLKQ